jgi:hypothetical protein
MKIKKILVVLLVAFAGYSTNVFSMPKEQIPFELQDENNSSEKFNIFAARVNQEQTYDNFIDEINHGDHNSLLEKIGKLDKNALIYILKHSNGKTFNHSFWKVFGLHFSQMFIGLSMLSKNNNQSPVGDSILGGFVVSLCFRVGSWPKLNPNEILNFECFMLALNVLGYLINKKNSDYYYQDDKNSMQLLASILVILFIMAKRWNMQSNLDRLLRELCACENDIDLEEFKAQNLDKLVNFLKRFAAAKQK